MKKEEFIKLLVYTYSDRGVLQEYSDAAAEDIWEKYLVTCSEIKDIFKDFLLNGRVSEIEVEGFNVKKLQDEFLQTEVAAFLCLDRMIKDPKFASEIEPPKYSEEYLKKMNIKK